jgi:hypothetical protein
MISSELFERLESAGAKYIPHTFDFEMDVAALVEELSESAQGFFSYANEHKGQSLTIEQLYLPRWCEDHDLIKLFDCMSDDEKLEILCLYTVPIHEFRHHVDMLLTLFGVHFYWGLAQEYVAFQGFSPFLLQNQDFILPGPLKELDERLKTMDKAIPHEWERKWAAFKREVLTFEAYTDFRGMNPVGKAIVRTPENVARVLGMEFEEVIIHGLAVSFSPKNRPDWYMRAATLLEGRAILASLLWIMWNLEGHPALSRILVNYTKTLYPSDGNYDYRFLLDIAAAYMGAKSIEESFEKHEPHVVQHRLTRVDAAAWFALQAAIKVKQDHRVYENIFLRFFYALKEMVNAYDHDYPGSPLELLPEIERLKGAQDFSFLPLSAGVKSTLEVIELARQYTLPRIWHADMRTHFSYIFDQLGKALLLRLRQGYDTPFATEYLGNPILYIDDDHQFVLAPYKPKHWVREWFRFRNESMFTPDTSARKRRHLAAQFGLGELVIWCNCGVVIDAVRPKWREHHRVTCGRCGHVHDLRAGDYKRIVERKKKD